MEVLASRLKWLREKERIGQKEVAGNIGVTLSGYQQVEYNKTNPKLETLVKIAKYFEVTTDFLLGLSDDTELISNLHQQLLKNKERLAENRMMQDEIRRELYDMQRELEMLEVVMANNDPIDKDELKRVHRQLEMYKQKLAYHDHAYYEVKMNFDQLIFEYFIKFYSIPHSRPEDNPIIKEYLPLDVAMEEFSEGNYKVKLKSLNGTQLGTMSWIQGADKENNYKESLELYEEYRKLFRVNKPD